jgi:hypothetical protein
MIVGSGLVSDLVLVRMHGRFDAYLRAAVSERPAIVAQCRRDAATPELGRAIVARTVYAQASSRLEPLRELLQNALDASPRGGRVDVRLSDCGSVLTVEDRGPGMSATEMLDFLLVPFQTSKSGDSSSVGEHGIGFFTALELAPRIEVTSATATGCTRLRIEPVGSAAPYGDFTWTLEDAPGALTHGTWVRLELARPVTGGVLVAEARAAASLVDPARCRIFVQGNLANVARSRMRLVARAPVEIAGGYAGDVELWVGRGEGVDPVWALTQSGLLVSLRHDAFSGPESGLHRDMLRALLSAGFGVVADLPLGVPLNKGRSAPAAVASTAVENAVLSAFERFLLEDALVDRETMRAIDHRIGTVLDRVVQGAIAGEERAAELSAVGPLDPPVSSTASLQVSALDEAAPTLRSGTIPAGAVPTVAAPPELVRFAAALLDAPLLTTVALDARARATRARTSLRAVLAAQRGGCLERWGATPPRTGIVYLVVADPLSEALHRKLTAPTEPPPPVSPEAARLARAPLLDRTSAEVLAAASGALPAIAAVIASIRVLEAIDAAVSASAGIGPSPIWVHQALYGPDEMAHTDGSGISINLASSRIRALLDAVLVRDDPVAFGALVDLLLHEKTHVALATYVPRPIGEHGATFYRKKDQLRRKLLEALASGAVVDPMARLPTARRVAHGQSLPSVEELPVAVTPVPRAA